MRGLKSIPVDDRKLWKAVRDGSAEACIQAIRQGADANSWCRPNPFGGRNTLWQEALQADNAISLLRALRQGGMRWNRGGDMEGTILHEAVRQGLSSVCRWLLAEGRAASCLGKRDRAGQTPLDVLLYRAGGSCLSREVFETLLPLLLTSQPGQSADGGRAWTKWMKVWFKSEACGTWRNMAEHFPRPTDICEQERAKEFRASLMDGLRMCPHPLDEERKSCIRWLMENVPGLTNMDLDELEEHKKAVVSSIVLEVSTPKVAGAVPGRLRL